MTEWEVQEMKEAEDARIWEELNAPDPFEKQMKKAALDLVAAANLIDSAEEELSAAVADLYDTPMEKVIDEYLEKLSDFRYEIQELAKHYAKGERD